MSIIISTRPAKCSDCKFLTPIYNGKRKTHKCNNPESINYNTPQRLKDRVCDKWELI